MGCGASVAQDPDPPASPSAPPAAAPPPPPTQGLQNVADPGTVHEKKGKGKGKGKRPRPQSTPAPAPEREPLSHQDALEVLAEALDHAREDAHLEEGSALEAVLAAMEPMERTASSGIAWQYRGRQRDKWYNFGSEDTAKIEAAHASWQSAGCSQLHGDRRFEIQLETGNMRLSLDFHLLTQRNMDRGGPTRVIRRHRLPSPGQKACSKFFDRVLALVSDVCEKLEEVEGCRSTQDLSAEEYAELLGGENECVDLLQPTVTVFFELARLCAAAELSDKVQSLLGEKRAARLGVAESGRETQLESACISLRAALVQPESGRNTTSHWDHVRHLSMCGKSFYDMSLLNIRLAGVKYKTSVDEKRRRHAFMLFGTVMSSGDDAFKERCVARLLPIMHGGMRYATASHDMRAVRSILQQSRNMNLGDFWGRSSYVSPTIVATEWLERRLHSAISSSQPLHWVSELVAEARDLEGVDQAAVLETLLVVLVRKCERSIIECSIQAEDVNRVAVFQQVLGSAFDSALFEALAEPSTTEPSITEWLVAYCQHTGVDLPPYLMNADMKETFDRLEAANGCGDVGQIKAAVIAAKLVPNLKENEELNDQFTKALDFLKGEMCLPPGWDIEALLGNEKMFKQEPVTGAKQLELFQQLMDSTHQKRWTRDRAIRGDGAAIASKFQVTRVIEVQNGDSWENYDRRRQGIISEITSGGHQAYAPVSNKQWAEWSGPVMTGNIGKQIAAECELSPLEDRCNEFLFLHGTKPEVADLIAENHFDISFASKDGMFGAGLYFAEASSKSDEYVKGDSSDEFPLILVRVTLGRPNYVDTKRPFEDPGRRALERSCMSGSYHSVIGDRIKVVGTYREFVVYDHYQCYPHFIVWYKRA